MEIVVRKDIIIEALYCYRDFIGNTMKNPDEKLIEIEDTIDSIEKLKKEE